MNYSKNQTYGRKVIRTKKEVFQERLFMSWGICFVVGLLIGGFVIWGITSLFNEPVEPIEQNIEQIETPSYGTIDGKVFNSEVSLDWDSNASLDFIPLDVPMDEDMQEFIYYLSYGYNIEFPFVMALIEHESSFRTNVTSSTNDYGLMQINKINHEWLTKTLGVTDFNDPYQNTRCGIFILRKLFEKYEDPTKVLMCYNMGEAGAKRLWDKGIYETSYSKDIMEQAAEYQQQISEKKVDVLNAEG